MSLIEPSDNVPHSVDKSTEQATDQVAQTDLIDAALSNCLGELAEIAPVEDPRLLLDLLPDSADEEHCRLVLCELIKLDMAAAAEEGKSPRLDSYLEPLSDCIGIDQAPLDLVIEELQLRRESGESVQTSDYAERFPQHADMLRRFTGHQLTVTSVPSTRPPERIGPGAQIDDFTILRELGSGAFAQVYLAKQESMQRLVALKVSRGVGDEPQALAQLDHPNIVRVYDQRLVNDRDSHLLYMQFCPGGTLAEIVRAVKTTPVDRRSGAIITVCVDCKLLEATQSPPDRSAIRDWLNEASWPMSVAWLGVQLAHALDSAHESEVLHRDVKPANVLLSAEGVPKLADFNVSFAGAAGRAGAAASFGGSIGYMSPEHLQAIGLSSLDKVPHVGEQADLYSLGVLLWELWQGKRPFREYGGADNWTMAVAQQFQSRHEPLNDPIPSGEPGERALEQTLRKTLSAELSSRPKSGAELAGRLRLSLHPETAELFDPPEQSTVGWIGRRSTWLIAAAAVLLPNIAAGLFNYYYNEREIIQKHPEMREGFELLATWVNSIAFPLGAALTVWFTRPVAKATNQAEQEEAIDSHSLDALLSLPHNAAWIGGALWGVASLIYPGILSAWYSDIFPLREAVHFAMSLLVCGGVAAVYPYFLIMLLATYVYYPRLLRGSMNDPEFDLRDSIIRRSNIGYLMAAAMIPLLSIALLVSRAAMMEHAGHRLASDIVLLAVSATAIGLLGAFGAYQRILKAWDRMATVLSPKRASQTPGLGDE